MFQNAVLESSIISYRGERDDQSAYHVIVNDRVQVSQDLDDQGLFVGCGGNFHLWQNKVTEVTKHFYYPNITKTTGI